MFAGNLRSTGTGKKEISVCVFVSEQWDNEGIHFSMFSRVLCLCVFRSLYLADQFIFQRGEIRSQPSRNSFFLHSFIAKSGE